MLMNKRIVKEKARKKAVFIKRFVKGLVLLSN